MATENQGQEQSLGEELRRLLEEADAQWTLLEHRLDQVQEETLQQYAEDLQQRYGLRPEDLNSSGPGGFAWKVKGRLHSVLLCPIALDMRNKVLPDWSSESEEQLVLDDILDRWEFEVEPLLGEAAQQDARLARRAQRKAQRGSTREALQATRERPAVWATARAALEAMEGQVRIVSAFMSQVVSERAERIAAAVPAVIARAVVDWHFRGPLAELEQLESWWEAARQALESREELWDRLVQEEGIFLRRIDRGVEALRSARQIYLANATFGTSLESSRSGWPTQTLELLSDAAAEMTSRLRPVRDSAAWRVVDAAKAIEKELSQDNVKIETWSTSERDAFHLIMKVLAGNREDPDRLGDSSAVLMDRSGKLMTLLADLRETFVKDDLAKVLDDLLRAVVSLREDVSVSDGAEALEDCVQQWHSLGEACNAACRLEAGVAASPSLRKEVNLRQPLALLRGLHVFVQRADLRAHLISEDGYESSDSHQAQGSKEAREVCHPPSPSRCAQNSPRGGYAPRRQRFKADESDTAGYSISSSPSASAGVPVAPGLEVPSTPSAPLAARESDGRPRSSYRSRPSTATRPSTPSWLRPPWQRSDTPLASWTRPDTPSTVCDDAEVANLPRWKVVDGEYVPLKPVNLFQSRIKDVTRKMMATVSELSMHQATAHKLQKERDEACERAILARENLENGQAPTEAADGEFQKMLQVEHQRELDRQAAVQRKQEEDVMNSNFTRTTAEPRVNAYIPDDEHGLPKAYGVNAPFKPTAQGSTMRFIRKPNPQYHGDAFAAVAGCRVRSGQSLLENITE
ncbi:unnamed protein product [Durusdinium trenchii]|uniref:Uncharacterized protein n=1 Tax=Durusdinium trenchii TaxID=1381693 RepID=A0ABP0HFS7_9DINO